MVEVTQVVLQCMAEANTCMKEQNKSPGIALAT